MNFDDFRLDVRRTLTTQPPALDYVLPGLLAGTVGLLVAPGAMGKTTLLTQLACDIAAGAPVGGGILTSGLLNPAGERVVFFLAEESKAIMHHRLQAALAGVATMPAFQTKSSRDCLAERLATNLCIYPLAGSGQRLHCVDGDGSVTDELKAMLGACEGARLVIIDPLRRFHAGEENDSAHMSTVVSAVEYLARRTGAAVILSHHANRSSVAIGTGDQASAARGSSALTDGVRWQANLSSVSDRMALQFPVANAERHLYVQLDVSKANYMAGKEAIVLRRNPASGALAVWTPAMADGRRSRVRSGVVGKTRRTSGAVQ
ncbi:Regulatory protein RepA [Caballeronia choica]|uniref:Regulatory protein RepA n=1 Tax=Caballeronia choica TaxID=326476 RepID=A0A158KNY6_9BURK|nr:AAA family ATPase [Caballeronia choica]SAL82715.1 Regulatory protein RepA [Caballeronia choica]